MELDRQDVILGVLQGFDGCPIRPAALERSRQALGDLLLGQPVEVDPSDQHRRVLRQLGEDDLHEPLLLGAAHALLDVEVLRAAGLE